MPKIKLICKNCLKEYEKNPSVAKKSSFCSRPCRYNYQRHSLLGENNPNYGNKWNEEKRKKASDRVKKEMESADRRYQSGCANRGKKFSDGIRERMSKARKGKPHKPRKPRKPYTLEERKMIGLKSKAKFTNEYKQRQRKRFEETGRWIPLDKKLDKEIYYKEANWVARMFDIVNLELLIEYGVWSYKNKRGVVRDHKYSRKSGFLNCVFPEILRHPVNCRLISHAENVRTAHNGKDDIITLEELFNLVKNYEKEWKEQKVCLEKIDQYIAGQRWENIYRKDNG